MTTAAIKQRNLFWAVSLAHTTIDIFNASIPVVLTFLAGHLVQMSNTQIGVVISAYQMMSALSQPLCGWLADRNGGRWLGAGGVAWTIGLVALSLVLAAATHSYALMAIPLVLAALGSGAFHPVGTMYAAESSQTAATTRMSIFFLMGMIGGGLGPALAGILLDSTATHNALFTSGLGPAFAGRLPESGAVTPMVILSLFSIPSIVALAFLLPNRDTHRAARAANGSGGAKVRILIAPLMLLLLIVSLRGLVNPGLVSFLPRLFQLHGWTASEYGLVTSVYWFGAGIMGVIFGKLADRMGSRLLIAVSMLVSAPAVFGLGIVDNWLAFPLAIMAGAFSGGSHSLIVALTQKFIPGGKGLASGMSLGFIFAMGALGVLVIGALSDSIGVTGAFQVVAAITFVTGLLSFLLPADRPARVNLPQPVEIPAPAAGD